MVIESPEETHIPVFLYGRISDADDDDGQETSLPNQREMMEEFAKEEGFTVVGWFYDRNISGATDPFERDGFGEMVQALREREDVATIFIKNGKRIARGESAEDIKKELKGLLGREVEIIKTHPEEMEKLEEEVPDFLQPTVEGTRKTHERLAIEEAKQAGKLTYQRKKQAGELCHRPPRGLTTDSEGWVRPVKEFREGGKRIRHKEFETCIEILNHWPGDDDGPYTNRGSEDGPTGGPSGYSVGKEYGISNPSQKVKSMWENRDLYRQVADNQCPNLEVKF